MSLPIPLWQEDLQGHSEYHDAVYHHIVATFQCLILFFLLSSLKWPKPKERGGNMNTHSILVFGVALRVLFGNFSHSGIDNDRDIASSSVKVDVGLAALAEVLLQRVLP